MLSSVMQMQPFSEYQAKFYAIQLILAVQSLHDQNRVHGDLKLEDLLLDARGDLRLIDYR